MTNTEKQTRKLRMTEVGEGEITGEVNSEEVSSLNTNTSRWVIDKNNHFVSGQERRTEKNKKQKVMKEEY